MEGQVRHAEMTLGVVVLLASFFFFFSPPQLLDAKLFSTMSMVKM